MSSNMKISTPPVTTDNSHKVKPNKEKNPNASPGATVIKEPGQPAIVYTPSKAQPTGSYDKTGHVIDKGKLEEMKADAERTYQGLRDMVRTMLERQGLKFRDVIKSLDNGESVEVPVDEKTRSEAQAAIAEDGHWGVKKTSERIIEFAKTVSGGDIAKYDKLVESIKAGFEAAKEAFGGELPEISQQTYDAVMKGLDEWAGKTPAGQPVEPPIEPPVEQPAE